MVVTISAVEKQKRKISRSDFFLIYLWVLQLKKHLSFQIKDEQGQYYVWEASLLLQYWA